MIAATAEPSEHAFMGLAPFLRMSIAGEDMSAAGMNILALTQRQPENANLWMNLAIAMFSLGQRDQAMAIQRQALQLQHIYHLKARQQPEQFRLLLLMAPGDLAANAPIECLLEHADIAITFYYLDEISVRLDTVPAHDALMVAMSESVENRHWIDALVQPLQNWPKPVINAPQFIGNTGRIAASNCLQQLPGLAMPPTLQISRVQLEAVAGEQAVLNTVLPGIGFPVILRPVDSHAGRDLAKIHQPSELDSYLRRVEENDFFISPFIDYSSPDGQFRKYRLALMAGKPFACHMAVSSHWMVHYVNAGMYEDAHKRQEEAAFMQHFEDFAQRHQSVLQAIYARTQLDYVCIDCAETTEGQLLIFEIDHAMVVHNMDNPALFPYKQRHMQTVQQGFRDFLLQLKPAAT